MRQKITTFLTYNDQAEEAVKLYVSVFKNSKVTNTMRAGDRVISVQFELEGQEFIALNGGPSFSFAEGISLYVSAETQAEIDELYGKLSAGGSEEPCGWLKDRFGVSWQVVPPILGELLGDRDPARAQRSLQAMLKMKKIDIAALKKAAAES
ncbi:MAG TPA: VOC family protein [Candidatus Limnocylindria bacterium]|nr:VOC family protein [Candidatus Limnocylindria bacterium]